HRLNVQMMHILRETLSEVDLVIQLFYVGQEPGGGERFVLDLLAEVSTPVILVPNKIDLVPDIDRRTRRTDFYTRARDYAAVTAVSALAGDGLEALKREIFQRLPEGSWLVNPEYTTT
ncbi:hypothetical protein RZS08_04555, partial [Arthrospira platensis SPKY1]|nr:hypothetical protein [Arthrospira platensis SPKY1]